MWKLQILLYSFLIPKEFTVEIGSLYLSPYRLLLIIFAIWVIKQLIVKRNFRWQALDTVVLSVCILPTISLVMNTDFFSAIKSGGILFLETFVPFLLTRLTIDNHQQLASISKTLLVVASIMAAVAIPEAITGQPFTHNIASLMTSNTFTPILETRMGIWRAYGPTDHPIILGIICAVALPIGLAIFRRKKLFADLTSFSVLRVIAAASSGLLLAVVAKASLYFWSLLTRDKNHKWWLLIFLVFLVSVFIDLASNPDPLRVMFSHFLFNEHNDYIRFNMWSNGFFLASQSIKSFLIGYGFSTEMTSLLDNLFWRHLMASTLDSYWLVILLRYGAPMMFLSSLAIVLTLRSNLKNVQACKLKKYKDLTKAWFSSMISLSLVGCTVHFWGSIVSQFFIVTAPSAMRTPNKVQRRKRRSHATTKHFSDRRSSLLVLTQLK